MAATSEAASRLVRRQAQTDIREGLNSGPRAPPQHAPVAPWLPHTKAASRTRSRPPGRYPVVSGLPGHVTCQLDLSHLPSGDESLMTGFRTKTSGTCLCMRIAVFRITTMLANRSQFVSSFESKTTAVSDPHIDRRRGERILHDIRRAWLRRPTAGPLNDRLQAGLPRNRSSPKAPKLRPAGANTQDPRRGRGLEARKRVSRGNEEALLLSQPHQLAATNLTRSTSRRVAGLPL